MRLPTKDDFAEWQQIAQRDFASDLVASASREAGRSIEQYRHDYVAAYIEAQTTRWTQMQQALDTTAVSRWMEGERHMQKALSAISAEFSKRDSGALLPEQEGQTSRLAVEAEDILERALLRRTERFFASYYASERLAVVGRRTYRGRLVELINSYLHEEVQVLYTNAKRMADALRELEASARRVEECEALIGSLAFAKPLDLGSRRRLAQRRLNYLEWLAAVLKLKMTAQSRDAERLFVFRMGLLNFHFTGAWSPHSIWQAMEAVGSFRSPSTGKVVEPYTEKQVGRICDEFKQKTQQSPRQHLWDTIWPKTD